MSEKPWTPGLLRIKPMDGDEGCREIQAYHEPGHHDRGRWYGIASTHGLHNDAEDAANARLFIAASALYDALAAMVDACDRAGKDDDLSIVDTITEEMEDAARIALSLARGESA